MSTANESSLKPFKSRYDFTARSSESKRVSERYPDRLPIICERSPSDRLLNSIDKVKFLVPRDLTCGQFTYVVRKRITLAPEHALFLMVQNQLIPSSELMNAIYEEHKDADGFLYFTFTGENTFG